MKKLLIIGLLLFASGCMLPPPPQVVYSYPNPQPPVIVEYGYYPPVIVAPLIWPYAYRSYHYGYHGDYHGGYHGDYHSGYRR